MQAKIRAALLVGLLIFSTGYGLVKQAKKAIRVKAQITAPHQDHGTRFLVLKRWAAPEALPGRVRYVSNRTKEEFKQAPIYFYYEAQYALAPLGIEYTPRLEKAAQTANAPVPPADFYLCDFTTREALEKFCAERRLGIIAEEGGIALAKRGAS